MRYLQQQLAGYPGAWVLYAIDDEMPAPVGFIWYRYVGVQVVDLLYVFTHENFRRKGVASGMLKWLCEQYPQATILGAQANEMSTKWLMKHEFIKTQNGWLLTPKEQ